MVYKVVLAPRAIADLRDIVLYIAPDRPEAARRLGFALIEKTKALGDHPLTGRIVPESGDPTNLNGRVRRALRAFRKFLQKRADK